MALAPLPIFAADCCKNSVAVVASLSGTATVQPPGSREKAPVSSLDWLSDGATFEVGTGSKAVLILSNGRRYELGQGGKATLTADATPKISGTVRELPALPPIPRPVAVIADSAPTPGAVRFRGGEEDISGHLYPRASMVALPDKVSLRFKAVPNATSYRVALENDGGDSLLNVTTESTEVAVPAGTIEAGARYGWRVRAMRSGTAIAVGTAEFTTLSAENALRRAEFASALGATDDPATLALLAGVDLRLGLIAEACDEFSAALKRKPDDAAWQRALAACETSRIGR